MSKKPRLIDSFVPTRNSSVMWYSNLSQDNQEAVLEFVKSLMPGNKFAGSSIKDAANHIKTFFDLSVSSDTVCRWIKNKLISLRQEDEKKSSSKLSGSAASRLQAGTRPTTRRG